MRLTPVHIAKPWGQEIWYSGIEARGESSVIADNGQRVPLSAYLAAAPNLLTNGYPVLLLKVLDPRPEPVLGDLYFEVHEEKREVYVVTAVDPTAWPDGTGYIRFGMNQALREKFDGDEAFRAAYLETVQRYEAIRRAIDDGASGQKYSCRYPNNRPDAPVADGGHHPSALGVQHLRSDLAAERSAMPCVL